jgi:uncharacterized protein (DUF2384 family)
MANHVGEGRARSRIMRHSLFAVTLTIAPCMTFASTVFADSCLDPVQAVGQKSAIQEKARGLSVAAWKRKVIDSHGVGYASWSSAKGQRVVCFSTSTTKSTLIYQCKARARPCAKLYLQPGLNDQLE